jgi:hypothetical protein
MRSRKAPEDRQFATDSEEYIGGRQRDCKSLRPTASRPVSSHCGLARIRRYELVWGALDMRQGAPLVAAEWL